MYKIDWCDPYTADFSDKALCHCHSAFLNGHYGAKSIDEKTAWKIADNDRDSVTDIKDGVEYLYCGHEPISGCGCDCIIAERKVS